MSTDAGHCVVVGAGQAGGCAVRALRDNGFAGRITLVGAEAAAPYERPPLSKGLMTGQVEAAQLAVNPPGYYADARIEFLGARKAVELYAGEYALRLDDGTRLAYDTLLLTTGARPRLLGVPGADLPGIFYLRTIADAQAIKARLSPSAHLAVIGGGVIGLELASSAHALGVRVTVLEASPRLMGRVLPSAIAATVEARHRAKGVEIALGCTVSKIETMADGKLRLETSAGAVVADLIVVGIGAVPNVELARDAGLAIDDGIAVDAFCAASLPGIYAAGDAASAFHPLAGRRVRQETWQNALSQAAAAARTICGAGVPYDEPPYSWSDQFDMNIQIAGFADSGVRTVLRGAYDGDGFQSFHLCGDKVVGAIAINRTRDLRIAQHLIVRRIGVTDSDLADESVPLRSLLAAA